MADQVFIQVRFRENTKHGEYNDCLYFTQAEYASKTQVGIDALKQERVNNYVSRIDNAPAPVPPTKAELQAVLDNIGSQLSSVAARASDLGIKLDVTIIKVDEVPVETKP